MEITSDHYIVKFLGENMEIPSEKILRMILTSIITKRWWRKKTHDYVVNKTFRKYTKQNKPAWHTMRATNCEH